MNPEGTRFAVVNRPLIKKRGRYISSSRTWAVDYGQGLQSHTKIFRKIGKAKKFAKDWLSGKLTFERLWQRRKRSKRGGWIS